MARRDLTRAAEILAGRRGTNPCPKGYLWDSGTEWDNDAAAACEPAPMLDSTVPQTDGTTRDNVSVPLSHTPLGVGHGTRETAEHASNGQRTDDRSCVRCAHVTRYGNCSEPVVAGLVERFGLVRHPEGGRDCPAFKPHPTELEVRAARLLAAGTIEPADLELLRERQNAHPAGEWGQMLDWCEAAARDATVAGDAGPSCLDRTAAGNAVSIDSEKRASGPISASATAGSSKVAYSLNCSDASER